MLWELVGAGWRDKARPWDGSIRHSPWGTVLYAVYKLPKARASRKKARAPADKGILIPPTSAKTRARIAPHDKILTNFLIFLLREFQSHGIFEHLHRKDAHCCESRQKSHSG